MNRSIMFTRKSFLSIIAVAVVLLMLFSSCSAPSQTTPANTPPINPKAEAANKDTKDVTLYFSYRGELLLAGETRKIEVPVSDTLEEAVIKALIGGPSADRDELTGLFWNGVTLVGVSSNEDILFVTLSGGFVATNPEKVNIEDGSALDQKMLAIYSIVNTIVEMGTYSRVQIYVDRSGSHTGDRISNAEAGFPDDPNASLDQLGRNDEYILTPENTLRKALEAYGYKDWASLYNYTAYTSPDGTVKPDITAFGTALDKQGNVLDSFEVTGSNVSFDGQTAVVMLNYTIKTRAGDSLPELNIPVLLVRDNDIWKLSYSSLAKILINVG